MAGRRILHYSILEELGRGGMGVVYKARDTKLERLVAIKFLPHQISSNTDYQKRFKIEARAAAAINHPNIAVVHSIEEAEDEIFIVMEYVDGFVLNEKIKKVPIETKEILNIVIQVAEGLKFAHKNGIIHRDIKANNIMLTKENLVKIMDFGLAKIQGASEITKVGTTVGTTYYMSPEQAKGVSVDYRTDIWSFGVLIYQMFTGEFPFKGERDQAIIYSILNEQFSPMKNYNSKVPPEIETIVAKMLKKDREERYKNLDEFIDDLQISPQKKISMDESLKFKADVPSIAILPFKNISLDEKDEYFADGLTEELIRILSHIRELNVIAFSSMMNIKNKKVNYRELGKELNANAILECSVQKTNYNFRINCKLINVEDGFYLWSEQYERILEDLPIIRDEITLKIIEKFKVHLSKTERSVMAEKHSEIPAVLDLFLKGKYNLQEISKGGIKKGIECFEKAISTEPKYAPAFAGIADAYSLLASHYFSPAVESYPKAINAAEKAIEIDDLISEAHCTLGNAFYIFNRDWKSAERSFLESLKNCPGYAFGHASYAYFLLKLERFDDAHRELTLAAELDPLGAITCEKKGYYFYLKEEYDVALKEYEKALKFNPDYFPLLSRVADIYDRTEQLNEAVEIRNLACKKSAQHPAFLADLGYSYALSGNKMKAFEILNMLDQRSSVDFVSSSGFALIYLGINDADKMYHWLEKSLSEKAPFLSQLKVDPRFDQVRDDPRFISFLKRLGLTNV